MAKKEKETKMEEKSVENPFENFKILNGPTVDSLKPKEEAPKKIEVKEEVEEEITDEVEETVLDKKEPVKEEKPKKEQLQEELDLIKEEEKYFNEKNKKINRPLKDEEEPIEKQEETEEFSFKPLVDHLASKNILDVPEDLEFEDNEEFLEKLVDNTATKRAEEKYNGFYESLPEEGRKLLEFMSKGGNPREFVNVYYNQGSYMDIKLDNESIQKDVIRDGLKLAGWDDDAIEEEVKDAEDLGKLETKSKMFLTKLQNAEVEQKNELLQNQELVKTKKLKDQEDYWKTLKTELDTKTEISGFPLNEKIKSQIWDHMSKPVDKKTGKTQLMLNNEKNKEAQYLYAYLDMMNWDISKLEKSVKTKVTSELRKNLNKFTDSRTKISKQGKTEYQEKQEPSFEAFKTLI